MDILVNRIRMFFLLIQHFLEFIDLLFCDNPLSGFLFTFRYLHLFSSFLLHPAVQQQFKYRHLCCELVPHLSCLDIRICLLTDAYAGKQLLLRK